METPAQNLSNSSATKLDSLGEFSTPPRPTKHPSQVNDHSSSHKSKFVSICLSWTVGFTPSSGNNFNKNHFVKKFKSYFLFHFQKATKKLFASPHSTRSDTEGSKLSSKHSSKEDSSITAADKPENCLISGEVDKSSVKISESEDSKELSLFSNLDNSANSIAPHTTSEEAVHIRSQAIEASCDTALTLDKNQEVEQTASTSDAKSVAEDKEISEIPHMESSLEEELRKDLTTETDLERDAAISSEDVHSLSITFDTESEDKSPVPTERKNFQYPTATQNQTQFSLLNQKETDSLGFSQWPSEVYEHVNKVISNLEKDKKNCSLEPCSDIQNVIEDRVENQDSLAFSQWPSEVYDNLDKAIASLENKENVPVKNGRNFSENQSLKKSCPLKTDKLTIEGRPQSSNLPETTAHVKTTSNLASDDLSRITGSGFTTASKSSVAVSSKLESPGIIQGDSMKKALSFFGENFSDLDTSKVPSFTKATLSAPKPATKVKDPISFFGEDLSDLDTSKIPSFTKASHSLSKPALKPKDPASFFGEDFSDLDQEKLNEGGFKFASKVLNLVAEKSTTSFQNPNIKLGGFSTASGKNVDVSAQSLNFIKSSQAGPVNSNGALHKQVSFSDVDHTIETDMNSIIETEKEVTTDGREKSCDEVEPRNLGGFSTASGIPVEISDASLNHIRSSQVPSKFSTVSEVSKDEKDNTVTIKSSQRVPKVSFASGFSTAGGAPVKIQEDALEYVRSSQLPRQSEVSTGFSTAGGKNVSVSKESFDHIMSSQVAPVDIDKNKGLSSVPSSKTPSAAIKLKKAEHTPKAITPIFKTGARLSLSLAQNSKRTRTVDQSLSVEAPSDKVRRRQVSENESESVISRIRRESAEDNSSPVQYLNKRRFAKCLLAPL